MNPIVEALKRFVGRAETNIVNTAPYGEEVKALGRVFLQDVTLANGMAFYEAFEQALLLPDAKQAFNLPNEIEVKRFRRFQEMLPAIYRQETIDPFADADYSVAPSPVFR
jgi:hypothetical protein